MKLELTDNGFEALNTKISVLQDLTGQGIIDPEKASVLIKEVRSGLYELAQLVKATVVINPADDCSDPAIA